MKLHTTKSYANKVGLTEEMIRIHCRRGTLECLKVETSGHGSWLILDDAEITSPRREKRKNKKDND